MPKLIKGENLTPAQVQEVKNAFVYRLTVENNYPRRNPCKAHVEPITDVDWIKQHAFYIRKDGNLAHTPRHCEPAFMADWPDETAIDAAIAESENDNA